VQSSFRAVLDCTSLCTESKLLVHDPTCQLLLPPGAIFASTCCHVVETSWVFTSTGRKLLLTSALYASFFSSVWKYPLLLLSALWILTCCFDHGVVNGVYCGKWLTLSGSGVVQIKGCDLIGVSSISPALSASPWVFGCSITLLSVAAIGFQSQHHIFYARDFDAMDSTAVSTISTPKVIDGLLDLLVWTGILLQFATTNVSDWMSRLTGISTDVVAKSTFYALGFPSAFSRMWCRQQNGAFDRDVFEFSWLSVRLLIGIAQVSPIEEVNYWRLVKSNEWTSSIDDVVVEVALPEYYECLVYWTLSSEMSLVSSVDFIDPSLPTCRGWIDSVFWIGNIIERLLSGYNGRFDRRVLPLICRTRFDWFAIWFTIFEFDSDSVPKCNKWIILIDVFIDRSLLRFIGRFNRVMLRCSRRFSQFADACELSLPKCNVWIGLILVLLLQRFNRWIDWALPRTCCSERFGRIHSVFDSLLPRSIEWINSAWYDDLYDGVRELSSLSINRWIDRIIGVFDSTSSLPACNGWIILFDELVKLVLPNCNLVLPICNKWFFTLIEDIVDVSSWTPWFCKGSLLTWFPHLVHKVL
jgi:hypothetical protein